MADVIVQVLYDARGLGKPKRLPRSYGPRMKIDGETYSHCFQPGINHVPAAYWAALCKADGKGGATHFRRKYIDSGMMRVSGQPAQPQPKPMAPKVSSTLKSLQGVDMDQVKAALASCTDPEKLITWAQDTTLPEPVQRMVLERYQTLTNAAGNG